MAGVTNVGILNLNGIVLRFDDTVRFRYESVSASGQPMVTKTSLNGLAFELKEGAIHLGEHRFEGLKSGDEVDISSSGIFVNGQHRWDMPSD